MCKPYYSGIIILSAYASYWFVLIFIPVLVVFVYIQSVYRRTSRELKRLDGTTRSPIFSTFGETLSGLTVIRAYAVQDQFKEKFYERVDQNTKCFLYSNLAERWLSIRVEFVSAILVLGVGLLVSTVSDSVGAGKIGIALTYALQIAGVLQYTVRLSIMVETTLTSVERLVAYSRIETEADEFSAPDKRPPDNWPAKGEIIYDDVKLRYRPELDLVLKGVSLKVSEKEKVGVAGRTGSGKVS
jgi:ATP-binding cassette subfamily C (CFTR/MRP) protein 1